MSTNFVLTAEHLQNALPKMAMATKAVHADDFYSPHRAIAPGMHVAVNYRYARDPENLIPRQNLDVSSFIFNDAMSSECVLTSDHSPMLHKTPMCTLATPVPT